MESDAWKLRVELVPRLLWGMSMSQRLKQRPWRQLRLEAIERTTDRCDACGAGPDERLGRPLNVHEVWIYDDAQHIQTLLSLRPLCGTCSACVHIGRTGAVAVEKGGIDMNELREHMARVNGVTRTEIDQHISAAFQLWRTRSDVQNWRQDYGTYVAFMTPENLKGSPRVR